MAALRDWIEGNEALLTQLGTASLFMLAISLVALPVVVAKLPQDYFVREHREPARRGRKHPLFWGFVAVVKNALGIVVVLAGLAMLVLPGQGIITVLIGLVLTNFPGKFAVLRRLVSRPSVGKTLNRIRELARQPSLHLPTKVDEGD